STLTWLMRTRTAASGRQPCAGSRHQRLHASFQRRMDDRRKLRAVIGWQRVKPTFRFGFRIRISVNTTDEPEHSGDVRRHTEDAEVLARGCRRGFLNPIIWKPLAECAHDALRGLGIVPHRQVAIERCNLWLLLRAR